MADASSPRSQFPSQAITNATKNAVTNATASGFAAGQPASYLDPETLAAVGPLDIRARMIVEGLMQGLHRSPHQGISVEFAQHRQYVAGDDIRHLDWKVFGRSDKLYLKQYQQETNLDLVLAVDTSGSMRYGESVTDTARTSPHLQDQRAKASNIGWTKFDCAATLAAAMAYMAVGQQDRVGLWLFDDTVKTRTRLSSSSGHLHTLVELLESADLSDPLTATQGVNLQPEDVPGRADLPKLFDQVVSSLTQRSLIVLMSDLFDDPEILEKGLARLHHRRHDVIVLQVMADAELNFPFRSPTEFVGLEAEGKLPVDPPAIRKAYMEVMQEHLRKVEEICRRFRFDYLLCNTREPVGPALSHFLARRAASIAKD